MDKKAQLNSLQLEVIVEQCFSCNLTHICVTSFSCCRFLSYEWHKGWSLDVATCPLWAHLLSVPLYVQLTLLSKWKDWGCLLSGTIVWGVGKMMCLRCHLQRGPLWAPCAVCEMLSARHSTQKQDLWHPSQGLSVYQTGRVGKPDQRRCQRQSRELLFLENLEVIKWYF